MHFRRPHCHSIPLVLIVVLSTVAQATDFTGKVIRIVDGDSLHARYENRDITIRLNGIDCPEMG